MVRWQAVTVLVTVVGLVVIAVFPVDVALQLLLKWLWWQLSVTGFMLATPLIALGNWQLIGGPLAAVGLLFLLFVLTLSTESLMLAIGDRWRSTWSRELFSPDHTWQRTFIEEWGRGPASRMVVFLVANLCMSVLLLTGAYSRTSETVAVAGNCTNVPCDAEEERQPAMAVGAAERLYSAMQTIIGVLTYVTALLVFRATKLNMLVPSRERRAKVACGMIYVCTVAALYAYNPASREGSVDFVQFLVLLVMNPLPTLVLGVLAVWPSLKVAEVRKSRGLLVSRRSNDCST